MYGYTATIDDKPDLNKFSTTAEGDLNGDDALSLWPYVDRLPARERTTLYLHYRADLTFEQVGVVMGITAGSARTYASRGVERLRGMFADQEEAVR